ncbi:MAG: radical SAM protein [Thermoplasmata archaeon]
MNINILHQQGDDDVARVYLGTFGQDQVVEFVDSLGGAASRDDKWVVIVSSMVGCPIDCKFCDAGRFYKGSLSTDEILAQVDHIVRKHAPSGEIYSKKFKVQFARMGEPALNDSVIDAIKKIPEIYRAENYMPCISTVAPAGRERWFEEILKINHELLHGNFQLQFSVHSTDEKYRDYLIPSRKWSLEQIAEYGERFHIHGRKVTLNFAVGSDNPIDVNKLREIFSPQHFAIKITPLNPTLNAEEHDMINVFDKEMGNKLPVVKEMREAGFDVYVSIGDLRENEIKSNCGQILMSYMEQVNREE